MHIAGITVNAAVLTTGIRIHAVPHAYIGTIHFVDNRLTFLLHVFGRRIILCPIINSFYMLFCFFIFQETVFCIELGTPALQVLCIVLFLYRRYWSMILPEFFCHK